MNRVISLHPLSLVLGVVFAGICFISMSQVGVTKESWGPPKRDILNVFSTQVPPIPVPPGGSVVVFTVPNDRWLTLTGVSATSNNAFLVWAEEFNGTVTEKGFAVVGGGSGGSGSDLRMSPASSGGAIGWTFRPGSNVVIKSDDLANSALLYSYALLGYISRE